MRSTWVSVRTGASPQPLGPSTDITGHERENHETILVGQENIISRNRRQGSHVLRLVDSDRNGWGRSRRIKGKSEKATYDEKGLSDRDVSGTLWEERGKSRRGNE